MADFDRGIRHTGIKTVQPDDVDQTSLPASYGDNRLILMARDPTSAHAYWEINVDRINKAATFLGGGKAFLRLVEPSTERILAEYETRAGHGRYWMPLPRAGRAYRADLAMVQNGRAVVLGQSNIVHAPPDERTALAAPVFVGRAERRSALRQRLTLPTRTGVASNTARIGMAGVYRPSTMLRNINSFLRSGSGSEARLFGIGSEARLFRIGSEGRLRVRGFRAIGVVTPVLTVSPADVAWATMALAQAIGDAGTAVAAAVEGASSGQTVVIGQGGQAGTWYVPVDDYGHVVPAPDQNAPQNNVPGKYYYFTGKGWVQVEVGLTPETSTTTTTLDNGSTLTIQTTSITNPDGTISTTVITAQNNPDGTTITSIVAPDGTQTATQTYSDGSQISTQSNPDGSSMTTISSPDGTQTVTQTSPDGSQTTTVTNPDGSQTTTVTGAEGLGQGGGEGGFGGGEDTGPGPAPDPSPEPGPDPSPGPDPDPGPEPDPAPEPDPSAEPDHEPESHLSNQLRSSVHSRTNIGRKLKPRFVGQAAKLPPE